MLESLKRSKVLVIILLLVTGGFRHGHIFAVSAVDARDDCVPPGKGGHGVERVVAFAGEAQRVQLDHEVVRKLPVHHLLVQLFIRRQGRDWTLKRSL